MCVLIVVDRLFDMIIVLLSIWCMSLLIRFFVCVCLELDFVILFFLMMLLSNEVLVVYFVLFVWVVVVCWFILIFCCYLLFLLLLVFFVSFCSCCVFFSILDSRFLSLLLLVSLLCRLVSFECVLSRWCSGLICLMILFGLKFDSEWNFRLIVNLLFFGFRWFFIWNVVCGLIVFIMLLKLLWLILMNLWLCSFGCLILDWFVRLLMILMMNGSFFILIVLFFLILQVSWMCGGCIFCKFF